MADLAKTSDDKLAQARPKAPSPDEVQRKLEASQRALIVKSAEAMLAGEEKIKAAKNEIDTLFYHGPATRDKADTSIKALFEQFAAAKILMAQLEDRHPAKATLERFRTRIALVENAWSDFKPGPGWPVLNPFKWKEATGKFNTLGNMKGVLSLAAEDLNKLKPFLLLWADRPLPAPKTPPANRPRETGPVKA